MHRQQELNTSVTDDDSDSAYGRCVCALGVNKKTGRVQWCPGFNCCKFLIVLSVIMLPLTIVLILLMRMDSIVMAMQLPSAWKRTQIDSQFAEFKRDGRCTAVRFGLSETGDVEERDLLKDVRTSFIPPDFVVIPPDCGGSVLTYDKDIKNLEDNYDDYTNYNLRQRRSSNITDDECEDEMGYTDNDSDIDYIVKSINEDNGVDEKRMGFHFISEGSKSSIRLQQAENMKKYMDTTVDPCQDFYNYACGNWQKLNPIPKDKAGYDTFEMLRESLDVVLRELLEEKCNKRGVLALNNNLGPQGLSSSDITKEIENGDSEIAAAELRKHIIRKRGILATILSRYIRTRTIRPRQRRAVQMVFDTEVDAEIKVKYLYNSCVDSKLLAQRGIQPLLNLLDSFGGWPVLEPNWCGDKFDWLNLTAHLRLFNNDILIVQWVGPDIKNSDENTMQLDQTSLGLPTRDYFLQESNSKYLDAYKEFMIKVMHLMGANNMMAQTAAQEVVDFEVELARITSSSEERANVSMLYKRMKIKELQSRIPEIDWLQYLSIVQDRQVQCTETIVIYAMDYMRNLVQLLANTDSKIIANYLLWRFVRHRSNNVDDRFLDSKQIFYKVLFGREQSPPRWKNCVAQANSNMGMALGAMFVRKYFDENSKEDTLRMTHELQQAFREILNSTDWLDSSTKRLAELKVNAMSLKIGYPDFILSRDKLNEKYKGLEIDPNKYFENTLNVLRHTARVEQQKLYEPVNKTIWQTAPAIVNAYYSRNKNQIMFPAGILQPPFYHRHFPRSLNYGGIGVVIGHELTHGFDDKGRLFDRNGNIHKWWSDEAINGFHDRARCLVSQYGNYTVSEVGISIDGESTQGENIADNGGIRQAFHAYQNWLDRNQGPDLEESERLPGLSLTSKQLFFLNFAQVWCGGMRPEATINKLKTAVHSPGRFRVIGTLSNSQDFAREYQCPVGTPMNPKRKCSVW